jgi:conjugal transfer pilus assembly protein TraV
MMTQGFPYARILRQGELRALCILQLFLAGCASLGSAMSPYSETFSCKNSDHGQCIHPQKAYEDASQDIRSRSDPAVTRDKKLLKQQRLRNAKSKKGATPDAYGSYRDSVYRELKGLIEAPETPMLRPAQAVRTLILPYADRNRPDRLYMSRFVYSVLETPSWVVGGYLVPPASTASRVPVLGQVRDMPGGERAPTALPMDPRP